MASQRTKQLGTAQEEMAGLKDAEAKSAHERLSAELAGAVASAKEADARIAEAQRGAAEASAKIAGATAEAAKANLELAKLKTPRTLTSEQQARISAAVSPYGSTSLLILE